jgi:hypothetical protein
VAAHINQAVHGAVSDALATALAIPAWLALGGAVGLLLWLWRTHVSLAPSHLDTHAPGPVEL